MLGGLNITEAELWLTLSGLILAILDFTGLKVVLDSYVDKIIMSLYNLIFENRTAIADWLEDFSKVILDFGIEVVKLAWGCAILFIFSLYFLVILSIFGLIVSLGFGWPILAFFYAILFGGLALVLPKAVEALPYLLISLTVLSVIYVVLWCTMKVAQPIVFFFPWSALLPIYWLLKFLNMFPGRTLGTIGLLIALASTVSQLTTTVFE